MNYLKMNNKATSIVKSTFHVVSSNLISLFISMTTIFIIPKIIGVEDFGYWQLYMFYLTYVGLMHLGWNDGVYLKHGGKKYGSLNKRNLFSQFYLLFFTQIVLGICIFIFMPMIITDSEKKNIGEFLLIAMILVNTRYFLLFVLQATNRLKEYSRIIVLDRIGYLLLVLGFLFLNGNDYKYLIQADLVTKFLSLIYAMYLCNEITFRKVRDFTLDIPEAIDNIKIGIKIVFANISSMLIVGNIRLGIEKSWDIATFGKISLMLSISNLMMIFINAIGIVLFPIIKRMKDEELPMVYSSLRHFLSIFLLGLLIFYFPINFALKNFLPLYSDVLKYLAFLFPIFIYEGRMGLLINTFLKALRKEKILMVINLICLVVSMVTTLITTTLLENLNITVLSILFILGMRSILADIILSKYLKLPFVSNIFYELLGITSFVFISVYFELTTGVFVYFILYLLISFLQRKKVIESFKYVKNKFTK